MIGLDCIFETPVTSISPTFVFFGCRKIVKRNPLHARSENCEWQNALVRHRMGCIWGERPENGIWWGVNNYSGGRKRDDLGCVVVFSKTDCFVLSKLVCVVVSWWLERLAMCMTLVELLVAVFKTCTTAKLSMWKSRRLLDNRGNQIRIAIYTYYISRQVRSVMISDWVQLSGRWECAQLPAK
jgi:hypothetical protein